MNSGTTASPAMRIVPSPDVAAGLDATTTSIVHGGAVTESTCVESQIRARRGGGTRRRPTCVPVDSNRATVLARRLRTEAYVFVTSESTDASNAAVGVPSPG